MSEKHIGKVLQVTGPVLDVRFQEGELPALLNAVEIDINGRRLVAEAAQQIGGDVIRCIAMSSTDGLVRGAEAVDTGGPITVPVGMECLGRVFNLLGEPVDDMPAPKDTQRWPIHRHGNPGNRYQGGGFNLPLCKGRQDWTVWRRRGRKDGPYHGVNPQCGNSPWRAVRVYGSGGAHAGGE